MNLLLINDFTLPLQHPVLKFLVILVIILFAPIIFNKLKIPHILGLIIAGAIIGPFGINLLQRDGSIILSGTAGLLYIMFLAGLEIDMGDLKKNSTKSLIYGLLTFIIPMLSGILAGVYLLNFSLPTSILIGSMFASHTLITYPIVTKLDIVKNRAVVVTVGGTIITVTLGLLVLAVIIGMQSGEVDSWFWTRLSGSIVLFSAIVLLLFPFIGRWFFKKYSDSVSQYIFVLVMVFLGAVLAQAAGVESIIGAFLAGLSLNRLIPVTSPLMNRISFVGNAIFIPFFLISVGMLIDYRAFFNDTHTLYVAAILSAAATFSKYLPALITQKMYGYTKDEGNLIFGLSNAQAAATLAAVLVGYNVITGYAADGSPIRLLDDSVLNGTIVMILVT
ncbi:MAG: cation:proton antiporter, partial [Bacteroidales bacterium]|nr:cation:proton antiporter [Bacteroidales bacterium]